MLLGFLLLFLFYFLFVLYRGNNVLKHLLHVITVNVFNFR